MSLFSFSVSYEQFDTERASLTIANCKVWPETERQLIHTACFGMALLQAHSSDGVARHYRCPGIIE